MEKSSGMRAHSDERSDAFGIAVGRTVHPFAVDVEIRAAAMDILQYRPAYLTVERFRNRNVSIAGGELESATDQLSDDSNPLAASYPLTTV